MTQQTGADTSLTSRLARALLFCSVASAVVLGGCESAMKQDYSGRGGGGYTDSLIARAVIDGSYRGEAVQSPTQHGGVKEFARIDSDGTSAITPAPATGAAITPATSMPATTQAAASLGQGEAVINLTLQEAIARAMRNSLAIKVEAYNPAIREAQIIEAEAVLDPVLFGRSEYTNTDPVQTQLFQSTNVVNWQNQVGIRKLLSSGGTAQIATGATYNDTQGTSLLTNPSWTGNVNLSLTQPLLRGFGTDVTQANIYLAQRDRRLSLATFRRQVITTIAEVEQAYYTLMSARVSLNIQERLLADTQVSLNRIQAREGIDADKAAISQARAALAARNAELVRARKDVRDASDRLKTLLNDPELDINGNALINPIDKPAGEPIAFNAAQEIETALRQRTELQEARLQIERADIVINAAKNDLLPKFDITMSVSANGYDDRLDSALSGTINGNKYVDYAFGGRIEVPIGNREAEARYRRRNLERRQALTQLVRIAQQIVLDVKLQLRDVLTSYQEIQARESARVAAGEELDALIRKEEIVNLTPEFIRLKLDAQSRLASAELQAVNALISYNLAITRLEQSKGTLLEYNRVAIDKPPVPVENEKVKIWFLGNAYSIK